ncbi:hypothetical protein ACN27J_03260 [Solwaraspora sp. WMMB762]|uniref:hypothetical protein n=1 Tax=Solwaraspora sp. WMMB762 TaxID=3404120 RepID=UPI003B92ED4C
MADREWERRKTREAMAADADRWGQPELADKIRRCEQTSRSYRQAWRNANDEQSRRWAELDD